MQSRLPEDGLAFAFPMLGLKLCACVSGACSLFHGGRQLA